MLSSNRHLFYLQGLTLLALPCTMLRFKKLQAHWQNLSEQQCSYVNMRVNYCNRLESYFSLNQQVKKRTDLTLKKQKSRYYLDMMSVLTLFPEQIRVDYLFGDVTQVPDAPTLVKSRPINDCNHNSVVMPFNRLRHFHKVDDKLAFIDKKDACVWRGVARQPHRLEFLQRYCQVPNLDVGCTDKHSVGKLYHKDFMGIKEQLKYKYILSIEGYDVATNLKWIMHSNSLCLMRKPRFETWYMEGALKPDEHYVLLKDDYSDLPEKIAYYQHNPQQAERIIANAQAYFASFLNPVIEDLVAYQVVQKYLHYSQQNYLPI